MDANTPGTRMIGILCPLRTPARDDVNARQSTIHRNPAAPVTRNADRHPNRSVRTVTKTGAIIAPSAVPLLKIPFARTRSFGSSSASVVFNAHGQLKASPTPSMKRHAHTYRNVAAIPVSIPAHDQTPTAAEK